MCINIICNKTIPIDLNKLFDFQDKHVYQFSSAN